MKLKPFLLRLLVLALWAIFHTSVHAQVPDANGVLYVKKGSTGSGNGWANAMGELGDALNAASTLNNLNAGAVKQIWVAAGTYYPMSQVDGGSGNARRKTFTLLKDVQIYGHFQGSETSIADRSANYSQDVTELSGDIGAVGSSGDNAYHVLTGYGDLGSALVDGFSVTGGNANDWSDQATVNNISIFAQYGGGLYLTNSASLTINDVIFSSNYAIGYGGAAFVYVSSTATFNRVSFTNNSAGSGGAVTAFSSSQCIYKQTRFTGNVASNYGGAVFAGSGSPQSFENASLAGNSSGGYGGGIYASAGSAITGNRLLVQGNSATSSGGGVYQSQSAGSYINTLVSGNYANSGAGIYAYTTSYLLVNSTIAGNNAVGGTGGAIFNNQSSGTINNSVIADNSTAIYTNGGSNTVQYSFVQDVAADAGLHNLDGTQSPGFANSPASSSAPFSTGTYTTTSGSPLVNAGSNALYPGLSATSTDLAGNARVSNYATGGVIDVGAYEKSLSAQTLSTSNVSKTYGDAEFDLSFAASSGLPVTYSSSAPGIVAVYQDASAGNVWKARILGAGSATITASQAGDASYDPTSSQFTVSVAKAALMIQANSATKVYGQALPAFSWTFTGFVHTDLASSLGGLLTATTTATATSPVGTYSIELSGATSDNYTFTYVAGTLSITAAPLTITPVAGQSKVYGASDPVFAYTSTGLVSGDVFTGALGRASGESVGTYALAMGTLAVNPANGSANYAVALTPATFSITQATSSTVLSSSNMSASYGDSMTLTAAVSSSAKLSVPSGSVSFTDGGQPIAACSGLALTGGQASCTTASLTGGAHTLQAHYSGDTNFQSSDATLALTVAPTGTSITLAVSPTRVEANQSVTLSANVILGTPSRFALKSTSLAGSVEFADAGTVLGSATLDSGGSASLALAGLTQGEHSLSATYTDASGNFAKATAQLVLNVSAPTPLEALTSVPALSSWMLALLGWMLACVGAVALRARVTAP